MKAACIILSSIVLIAILAVCIMVKFATEITVEERKREPYTHTVQVAKSISLIALNNNAINVQRFPYMAAIASNNTSWSFACFASVVLAKWLVTSAHCKQNGANHRVILMQEFARNITRSYQIIMWRVHEKYDTRIHDIAVAKFDVDHRLSSSTFDGRAFVNIEAGVWKTVSTMDRRVFLINDIDSYRLKLTGDRWCYESLGVQMWEGLVCVDMSDYADCFVHEFGPLYSGDRLVGVLTIRPRDCDVKLAVFTNVSYYSTWLSTVMRAGFFG